MGIFDSFSNRFRPGDEDEDYENEDMDDYDDEEETPRRSLFGRKPRSDEEEEDYEPSRGSMSTGSRSGSGSGAPVSRGSANAAVQPRVRSNAPGPAAPNGQVQYIHPTLFEDAQQIADILRNHHMVLLNLEGLDSNLAQRIVDFSTGSCYALRGHFRSISASDLIIVFTPEDVGIGEAITISASKAAAASSNAFGGASAQSRSNPSGMNMNTVNGMPQDSANPYMNSGVNGAYGRNGVY